MIADTRHPIKTANGTVLVCVDGSEWAIAALRDLVRRPLDRIVLLYVSPSAARGYVECGWMVLEAAMHRCRDLAQHPPLQCRLEVGDAASLILAVCREERAGLLALSISARSGFPTVTEGVAFARTVEAACACPVLLTSARGTELAAGERVPASPGGAGAGFEDPNPSGASAKPPRRTPSVRKVAARSVPRGGALALISRAR
jgi:universal stress protein family protein